VFALTQPSEAHIAEFLARAKQSSFSYADVGLTESNIAPRGFNNDHNRILLGSGASAFDRAVDAIRAWKMFAMPNAQLCWPSAPIEAGTTVVVMFHHFGFWSLNAARIVYTVTGADGIKEGDIERFGFAYGTLADHAECGEERFTVEWNHRDDSVFYDLFAFSHPRALLPRIAKPLARRLQRNFVRESQQAMLRAVLQP
jgi:uncharacterized protein (UPF0548 family)